VPAVRPAAATHPPRPRLLAVASFINIGVVWVSHHSLFTRIAAVDGGLLWCNLAVLLAASVLPFRPPNWPSPWGTALTVTS
jgi:hypothetical protein